MRHLGDTMKNSLAIFYFLAVFILCVPGTAHAYIDPGVGSMLLQGLAAVLISGLIFFRSFRRKIKSFFSKNKDEAPTPSDSEKNGSDE